MTRTTLLGMALAVLTSVGVLAGCGDNTHTTSDPGTTHGAQGVHNEADVAFASQMIPHHAQAVEMATLVHHTGNLKVLALADRIDKAQAREIATMTTWLRARGVHVPASGDTTESDHSMPGMAPHDDMNQLEQTKDAEFDRLWLSSMIRHHEGAIQMANTELGQGSDEEMKRLARQILETQQAEIAEMQALLPRG